MTITPQPRTRMRRPLVDVADRADELTRVPDVRSGAISRTALVNRLRTHRSQVVLLTAPAGYGKTTLLAQWARRDARPFAWVTADDWTDDTTLAHFLAAAIAPDEVESALDSLVQGPRAFVRKLGRLLLAGGERNVIVVDRVECLSDRRALALLGTLAENLPPLTQLVLSGRRIPSLPLARYRVEGRLLELHATDLQLTERETASLLHTMGIDLDDAELDDLQRRMEGWAGGLYLSALALQPLPGKRRRDPLGFSGSHHFVADYLEQEVFAQLSPELASFATEASLLDRMSGPTCDGVLDRRDSGDRLAQLAELESFVVPLDREHATFRFHRLFREALVSRLAEHAPHRFAELSLRAADWYAEAGDIPTALRHIHAIGDRKRGAELLGAMLPDVCAGTTTALVHSLGDIDDDKLLHQQQAAAVVGALVHALHGNAHEADRWTAAAETGRAEGPLADGSKSSAAWVSLLRATLARDGAEHMTADATRALKQLAAHSPLTPFALLLLGVAHLLAGERAAAEAALVQAAELAGPHAPLVTATVAAELSLLAQEGEDWLRAEDFARVARDAAEQLGDDAAVFAALAYAASARSALRNSNWVRAGNDIQLAQQLLPRANESIPWLAIQVRVELARAHLALNDIAAASEHVTDIDQLLLLRPHLKPATVAVRELQGRIAALRDTARAGSILTAAELRLLPLLTTHLTFRQIAQHLYVSRNTVKTQSISVYRKLGVSSRTEAIDRAIELGLLKPDGEVLIARPH